MSFAAVGGALASGVVSGMMKDGGDSGGAGTSAPDPEKTARAQGRENRFAALADKMMSTTNQYNPFYSIGYEYDPSSMAAQMAGNKRQRSPVSAPTAAPTAPPETDTSYFDPELGQQITMPRGMASSVATTQPGVETDQYNNPLNDQDFVDAASRSQVMRLDPAMLAAYNTKQAAIAELGKSLFPQVDWSGLTANKFQNRPASTQSGPKPEGELPDM